MVRTSVAAIAPARPVRLRNCCDRSLLRGSLSICGGNGAGSHGEPAPTSIRVRSACRRDDVGGLGTLGTLDDLELHTLAFGEGLEAVHRDRGEVDEDVVPTLALDEAVALLVRKPLDGALLHYFLLQRGATSWPHR